MASTIAGIVSAIAAATSKWIVKTIGLFTDTREWNIIFIKTMTSSQSLLHILISVFIGILYVRFYDLLPMQGLAKAVFFNMIFYFFMGILPGLYYINKDMISWALAFIWICFWARLAHGIVLGNLHSK